MTFTSGPDVDETTNLLQVFSEVFCDLCTGNDQVLWQIKDEEWKREFVDVQKTFPDRAILKALLVGEKDTASGSAVSTK